MKYMKNKLIIIALFMHSLNFSCERTEDDFMAFASHLAESQPLSHTPPQRSFLAYNFKELTDPSGETLTIAKRKPIKKRYYCSQCDESYSSCRTLIQHERSHSLIPKYHCPECDKIFDTPRGLGVHKNKHDSKKIQKSNTKSFKMMLKEILEASIQKKIAQGGLCEDRPNDPAPGMH